MEDGSLCGGRNLLEGLHARFACMHIWAVIRFAQTGEWECGFSVEDGWILMEEESLCGGRTFLEGLHARFARMHIWAVIRFAQTAQIKTRS